MADSDDLKTYKLQLQQVEAALTTDPENEELLKLQKDLKEVIQLTSDLLSVPTPASGNSGGGEDATSAALDDDEDESGLSSLGGASSVAHKSQEASSGSGGGAPQWKIGDKCMAFYDEDGQHYEAVIEELLEDGTCTVTYTGYNQSAICPMSMLKPIDPMLKRGAKGDRTADAKKSKKDLIAEQREYKRKKAQKKAQRMKQLDEEHEQEKNKWLDFNVKTFSKTTKGRVKRSIFATPDTVQGKVGVGTCGSGGKPMTSYQHQEKWKK